MKENNEYIKYIFAKLLVTKYGTYEAIINVSKRAISKMPSLLATGEG